MTILTIGILNTDEDEVVGPVEHALANVRMHREFRIERSVRRGADIDVTRAVHRKHRNFDPGEQRHRVERRG